MKKIKTFSLALMVGLVLLFIIAGISAWLGFKMVADHTFAGRVLFHSGIDCMGVFLCIVLYYGCVGNGKEKLHESTRYFVLMILMTSMSFLFNECSWFMRGEVSMQTLNVLVNLLKNAVDISLIFCFWRYVRIDLGFDGKFERFADMGAKILLVPAELLVFFNLINPICFGVDQGGIYYETELYWLTDLYLIFVVICTVTSLIRSDSPLRDKLAAGSFIGIPIFAYAVTLGQTGLATQYGAILLSLFLMYSILFSERGKKLASTQTELNTAAQIQESMIPSIFPAFPSLKEFDLYGSMDPAKEVGGDFYDFFLVDDDHLCMVMADVSGKGVPAALFMMASKIILSNNAKMGKSPSKILEDSNDTICATNKNDMFVTVWIGILEISTGKLTAANAGHEYPAIRIGDSDFELYKDKHGLVVGGMEGLKYKEYEIQLTPGSKVFLYTDGVPEATSKDIELFGTDRMIVALNQNPAADPKEILSNVRASVDEFVGGAEQFDDLTMLCLEYKGTR